MTSNVVSNLEKRNMGDDPDRFLTLTKDNFDIAIGLLYTGDKEIGNLDLYFTTLLY